MTWIADGRKSYFGDDGASVSGWLQIDGDWYYFDGEDANRSLKNEKVVDGKDYYFGGDGVMRAGWVTWIADGRKSYFGGKGVGALVGWQDIDGKRYHFGTDYRAFRNEQVIDGKRYYFGGDGVMRFRNEQVIDGKRYYFGGDGVMRKNCWIRWIADGRLSYFGSDGAMYTGTRQVNGVTYNFGSSGRINYQYVGFQNPAKYYQVSCYSVSIKNQGSGIFGYRTPSAIPYDATRNDCVNAMITRAYDYLGDPYRWDYSCAPGVGVDCAGLVMQALYATGMDLSPMNPWDHYYTYGHDHYANDMRASSKFKHVSFSSRKPGDLIFYSGHVAIYIGSNRILDAYPPKVRTASVYSPGSILAVARPFVD